MGIIPSRSSRGSSPHAGGMHGVALYPSAACLPCVAHRSTHRSIPYPGRPEGMIIPARPHRPARSLDHVPWRGSERHVSRLHRRPGELHFEKGCDSEMGTSNLSIRPLACSCERAWRTRAEQEAAGKAGSKVTREKSQRQKQKRALGSSQCPCVDSLFGRNQLPTFPISFLFISLLSFFLPRSQRAG